MLKKLAITVLLALTICASGCTESRQGAGVRPIIYVGPKPEFTPDEQKILGALSSQHPDTAKKIVGRNNELSDAIAAYNRKAIDHNRKLMQDVGVDQETIDRVYPKK